MYLIFDTETTGLPKNFDAPHTDLENWPRLVQIAWQLHDSKGKLLSADNLIVKPEGFTIPYNAEKVHGISTEIALAQGHDLKKVLQKFATDIQKADLLIGHNIEFDLNIMGAEFIRTEVKSQLWDTETLCTKLSTVDFVAIPGGKGGGYKWATLTELHQKLFGKGFDDAHDAAYDVEATARCFFGILAKKIVPTKDGTLPENITYEPPQLDEANFRKKADDATAKIPERFRRKHAPEEVFPFCHLHLHSQFSILNSTASLKKIIAKAQENNMEAVAITDHGNLHAAFNAVSEGAKNNIKVIVGCEFHVAEERTRTKFTKAERDFRFSQVLLATDQASYHRLAEMCSRGYTEGFYFGVPRIGKDLIEKYHEGLIALTGGYFNYTDDFYGEIPYLILNKGEHQAEEAFKWWHGIFGDNFYVEIMRHGLEEEERINQVLLKFADKYHVKIVATNNAYYIDKSDADAHDTLLCVKGGRSKSTPVGWGRKNRFGFPNHEYYMKTQEEMNELFYDIPSALENTKEIIDKCSPVKLKRDILMPRYELPPEFDTQDDYLRYLTYEGAKNRYPDMTDEIRERLDRELKIIQNMGFPGYFLIVQDFINASKKMGVAVGPGRGSAAGSAVAFCTGITNIDPIKYNLLFERFLNPERVSMPDIDIDFDDVMRQNAIDYVVKKYGQNQVAQIITYGTMAAKMSIKDVARVLELPLDQSNMLAKFVPDKPGTKLTKAFEEVEDLKKIYAKNPEKDPQAKVLHNAKVLEGSVRGTGIHAAGVIIAPDDLMKYIPVCTSKDADLWVTQFDGRVVEDAGMLKMDFLGLKTLTIIKDAIKLIEKNHGVKIDPDLISLDDQKTFELYQRGETVGTFQFESDGMRKYLKDLKPTDIEDLIAMNALYRPGPLQYIPMYINRKHGKEKVEYPHELLRPILEPTYGIMIYQEQIMQTAQILAGYSLGGADILRRAMGKKKFEEMQKQRAIFVEGAKKLHGIPKDQAEEIFDVMEGFAAYGFNRSHSAAYSVVAYQTAYLKANYTPEYMAAVMTHSMGNIDKISFFMEECKNINVPVLGPDVNESSKFFDVNKDKQIRFGLGAIKGAGDAAVESIIEERENGHFVDIHDFTERINLRTVNKKTFESLAYAGAFDCFEDVHRAQFFHKPDGENTTGIEKLIKYGNNAQEEKNSSQVALFGGGGSANVMPKPKLPECNKWSEPEKLAHEKEVVGFFITGHPLDQYRDEIEGFCTCRLNEVENYKNREIKIGGIISQVSERQTKTGKPFALFTIEDYDSSLSLAMFGEEYLKAKHLLETNNYIFVKGKVEPRYNQEDTLEFRPKSIELLSEVKEKYAKELEVFLELDKLDNKMLADLQFMMQNNKGQSPLRVHLFDPETQQITRTLSNMRINLAGELPDLLRKAGLKYKMN